MTWPNRRFLDLVGIDKPIVLAPMIGPKPRLAAHVAAAGGLGSIGCASMSADAIREIVAAIRAETGGRLNLNFFCHAPPSPDAGRDEAWRARLAPYYREYGLDPAVNPPVANRAPFDATQCALVEELRPAVVSFHFGLPEPALLDRV